MIHVSFDKVLSYVYVSILSYRFSNDRLWFLTLIHNAFHPSLQFRLHALGDICYTKFYDFPCTPRSLILEDVSLGSFPL